MTPTKAQKSTGVALSTYKSPKKYGGGTLHLQKPKKVRGWQTTPTKPQKQGVCIGLID